MKGDLLNNSGTAEGLEGLYSGNAAGINSTLTPALEQEVINPQGYSPTQMAAQTTAAEQSAGGSNAGATGGALLRAARTRNAGAAPAAIDQSNRNAGQDLSQVNAGIQNKNANLQQQQRQQGTSGLEGMYSENVNAGNADLGLSNSSLSDAGNLQNFWQQYFLNAQKAAASAAEAGGA